jgi:ribosomal protein L37AE/L43A
MPIKRAKAGIWCDYCRNRFPKGFMHEKGASWTIVSESNARRGMERHLCQSCTEEVSKWGDGVWELQEQINYTCQQERILE